MTPELVKDAQRIGGDIALVFQQEADKPSDEQPRPHWVYLQAIVAAIKVQPQLNDAGFVRCLLRLGSEYSDGSKASRFRGTLETAVKWCSPQSLKLLADFNPGFNIWHRRNVTLPNLQQTLVLLTGLAGAGLHPVSAEALQNCCKLLIENGQTWEAATWLATKGYDACSRACSGEEMVWA